MKHPGVTVNHCIMQVNSTADAFREMIVVIMEILLYVDLEKRIRNGEPTGLCSMSMRTVKSPPIRACYHKHL